MVDPVRPERCAWVAWAVRPVNIVTFNDGAILPTRRGSCRARATTAPRDDKRHDPMVMLPAGGGHHD